MATNEHGWVSFVGGSDNSHLTDEQRQMVEEGILYGKSSEVGCSGSLR